MGSMRKCPNCLFEFESNGKQLFCSHKCKDSYGHRARSNWPEEEFVDICRKIVAKADEANYE